MIFEERCCPLHERINNTAIDGTKNIGYNDIWLGDAFYISEGTFRGSNS
jgi:hypothetical protein